MLGSLNQRQCEFILVQNNIGRIGCFAEGRTYIFPITYVYEEGDVYCHSYDGTKIKVMRKNRNVCFQVDNIDNLASWRSVLLFGVFEEIKSPAQQQKAKQLFMERLLPLTLGESVSPGREFADPPHQVEKRLKPVMFKIKMKEIGGRFEKHVLR